MDAYGGSDEDSAELRKLLAEVVQLLSATPFQYLRADPYLE